MSFESRLAALDLPLPLKREVDRILGLLNLDKRHEELLQAAEMTCRISGLTALAVCRHSGIGSEALDRVCAKLDRPSFGIWVELLRTGVALLREHKDDLLRRLAEGLATRIAKGSALEELARVIKSPLGKPAATVQEIFDAFPQYRNAVRGHGVGVEAADRERAAGPLLEGLIALWEAAPPTGSLRVAHVVQIEETSAGAFASLIVMHGSAPTVARIEVGPDHEGSAGTTHLWREPSTWIRLTPLAAVEEAAGGWQLGWLAGTVFAPTFNYQTDARTFQASTTQDEYEDVLGARDGAGMDAEMQARLRLDPYRGLLAYEEVDHPVYFGREEESARALSRLKEKGALVISGASGSGKSSLMRAGLLPRLKKGTEDEQRDVVAPVVIPGRRPLDAIRAALRSAGPDQPAEAAAWSRLVGELLPDPGKGAQDGLAHLLRGLAVRNRTVVLCVDQLEELVTNDVGPEERGAFLDAIAGAVAAGVPVVMTVRSDLIGPLLEHEGFRKLHDACVLSIGGLGAGQLQRIIREPLKGRHVEIEQDLPEAIVREVAGRPGALALLSQVLTTLWEERGSFGNRLTRAGYDTAGGVQGCVAAQATKARDEVPSPKRALLDAVLLQLVSRGDQETFVRRRVALDEVAQALETSIADERAVLAPFVARRLIVLSRDPAEDAGSPGAETVEVAHEALISGWPHFRDLVATQAEVLDLRRKVEEGSDAWEAAGRRREFWNDDNSNLRRAEELTAAGRLSLPARRREFLAASRSRVRLRKRLQRIMIGALGGLLVAAAVGFALADQARRDADEATKAATKSGGEAKEAKAEVETANKTLARQARLSRAGAHSIAAQRDRDHPRLALAWAAGALRLDPRRDAGTWRSGMSAIEYGGSTAWVSPNGASNIFGNVLNVAFREGGKEILFGTDKGQIGVMEVATGDIVASSFITGVPGFVCFSADRSRVATGSYDSPDVWLWDTATGSDRGRLPGHAKRVLGAAFSRDGRRLASSSADGTIKLWDVDAKTEIAVEIPRFEAPILAVALHPDATRICVADDAMNVLLWDVASKKAVRKIDEHRRPVMSIAFSPDGSRLATGSEDGWVRVYDAAGVLVGSFHYADTVFAVAFSRDASRVLGTGSMTAVVWDVKTGQVEKRFIGHTASISSIALDPEEKLLASGAFDHTVRAWSVQTAEQITKFDGHTDQVRTVAYHPDGKRIASSSDDGTVRVWDAATGAQLVTCLGHTREVDALAISHDGRLLLSGADNGVTCVWDCDTGREMARFRDHRGTVTAVAFSSAGLFASAGADGLIFLRDGDTLDRVGDPSGIRVGPAGVVGTSMAFSPEGDTLLVGGSDGVVRILRVPDGVQVMATPPESESIRAVAFDPDGSRVFATGSRGAALGGGLEHAIVCFGLDGKETARRLTNGGVEPTAVTLDPRGTVAWAAVDGSVRIDGRSSGRTLQGSNGVVRSIAFSPDGTKLVMGAARNTVCLWDLVPTSEIWLHEASSIAFSIDGKYVAAGYYSPPRLEVSRIGGGEPVRQLPHSRAASAMAFSLDGWKLATGSEDHGVRVFDLRQPGAPIAEHHDHTEVVNTVAFNDDGTIVASASAESAVRLWTVGESVVRRLEGHKSPVVELSFPDHDTLAVMLRDDSTLLWNVRTGKPSPESGALTPERARLVEASFPPSLSWTSTGICSAFPEWWAAWWAQRLSGSETIHPDLEALLTKWENRIGIKVDLRVDRLVGFPQPGSAYLGTPNGDRCR